MRKRFGSHTNGQSEGPQHSLPNGFPAGVRRVVELARGVEPPFTLGDRVVVNDADLDTIDELAVIGYEEGHDVTTWYLGEWVHDWHRRRVALLRALDGRAIPAASAQLGAVRATFDIWIASLDARPDLYEGARVPYGGELLVVAGYLVRGDKVSFVLRDEVPAPRADHPSSRADPRRR